LILQLKGQKQADLCEFTANLVYVGTFLDSQSYTVRPCLKKQNKTKDKKTTTKMIENQKDRKGLARWLSR